MAYRIAGFDVHKKMLAVARNFLSAKAARDVGLFPRRLNFWGTRSFGVIRGRRARPI
jgi:hypothetical protein